ncbi:thromboxane-A synthase [Nematolebias whitei]|uniref:thromboxane-A synthase n=1 Tax=Nematolebias whitei TaxID=451745 RepID=UPI0018993D2F|nr:thromboxane-A synthase [Nematolebias whitei]
MELITDLLYTFSTEASRMNVTLSLFFIFLGLLYWFSVYPFSVLSRYGIKHPKTVPFFGNMLMFHKGYFESTSNIVRTHGKLCGYYFGRKPVVLLAEPDLIKQVMVKEFGSFPNRIMLSDASKPLKDTLPLLRNERWKRVRSVVTPTFSAAKMKEMVPLMNIAIDTLMNNLSAHAESEKGFDINKCFSCFALDVIASVAFGTQVDSHKTPDNPLVRYGQMYFSTSFFRPFVLFRELFPAIMTPLSKFFPNKKREEVNKFYIRIIQRIIKQREEQAPDQRRRDFLQLLLDARTEPETVSLDDFDTGNQSEFDDRRQQTQSSAADHKNSDFHAEAHKRRPQKQMLTEDDIVGQVFIFLVGGFENVSNTLAFASYLLALHPECQRKVLDEVDDFFTRHDSPDYTNIQELKYLDMVVCETLRLYPIVFRIVREIKQNCALGDLRLPKGMLEIPAGFLHFDPDHWPEPEKFNPERFTPEARANRHPFVYLPFGTGPRNCVGMRLAQLEIRMALAHLFHKFSVTACSETKVPLELKSISNLGPKNGVFVKITTRDN